MLNQKKVEIFSRKFRKSLAKQFLEVALTIFCGGDIKLSVMVVWGKNVSHVGKVRSHLRKVISQKVFLCKCKPTARDFGKRFAVEFTDLKKLTKVFADCK